MRKERDILRLACFGMSVAVALTVVGVCSSFSLPSNQMIPISWCVCCIYLSIILLIDFARAE